jgi:uncharacterized protein
MLEQLLIFLIIFFSSATQTTFGFGFSLIALPLLSIFMLPKIAISLKMFLGFFLSLWLACVTYSDMRVNKIIYLVIGSLFGVPLGAKILEITDPNIIKIFVNIVILITVLLLWKKKIKKENYNKFFLNEKCLEIFFGFSSGFLSGSTGIPGPPIILYGLFQRWEKKEFRANLIGYFAICIFFTNVSYFINKILDPSGIYSLIIPGFFGLTMGIWFGKKIFKIFKSEKYFLTVLLLITIISCFSIIDILINHFIV